MADITLHVVEPSPIKLKYVEAAIKPEQTKDVVPSYEAQTVLPDAGMTLGRVNVAAIPDPTDEVTITENGDYNVARIGTAHVDVQPTLETATITPTEQTQTVTPGQGYDGLSEVVVNPIPSEYVVPSGSVDITQNGETSVAGKATAIVNVPGIVPSGTKEINITQNGTTTHDVTQYVSAEIVTNVNADPAKGLVFGDYDADGFPHSARFVNMTAIPMHYCNSIFVDDGWQANMFFGKKIKEITIPNFCTHISAKAFYACYGLLKINFPANSITIDGEAFRGCNNVESLSFNDDVTLYGTGQFNNCYNAKSVVFAGEVNSITQNAFVNCSAVELYDFSHCTAIPPLYSVDSLRHKSGCVLKIPSALSDTTLGVGNGWESATNWNALTNIVWEVV